MNASHSRAHLLSVNGTGQWRRILPKVSFRVIQLRVSIQIKLSQLAAAREEEEEEDGAGRVLPAS